MGFATRLKWLTAFLELLLGIPILGATIILSSSYMPLLLMLCLHIVTLIFATLEKTKVRGSIMGIITSCLAWIPFVGMTLHIITGILLLKDALLLTKRNNLMKKHQLRNQKTIEKVYLKELAPYIKEKYHLAVDTNFLMHFHHMLYRLFKKTDIYLVLHPVVFRELEGLKKNVETTTRYKAQKGFDIIEKYQNDNRLLWVQENTRDIQYSTADEQIISDLLTKVEKGSKLVFASHDKGARILARRLDIPVINPKKM